VPPGRIILAIGKLISFWNAKIISNVSIKIESFIVALFALPCW
jgi:hypothetical protein